MTFDTISKRERDYILAALRVLQASQTGLVMIAADDEWHDSIADIATEHGDYLTADEVDSLCEKLNV